ncbi:glycerophosphodiester phosphodiesterase family protein [Aureivirga sp. CE67]|uniref:glycerophosphodiester phosphodiesterase family protein n=1 Tax=Aureivirga sp. CE67 TaxID=1788983 RepID=UPI0018C918A7|nr:glycerophosphodiester phosphodiesterase family protein [Aureivirga sp. CE67]
MRKLIYLFIFFSTLMMNAQVSLIAHRGASYIAPENSMAAVKMAWQMGFDVVEVDVRLTKDKQIIVFHDENTKRMTGVDKDVSESTYDELKDLKLLLSNTNSSYFEGETIPLLSEILDILPKDKLLVIEAKESQEIVEPLQKILKNHWKGGELTFISFHMETLCLLKEIYSEIPALYLSYSLDDVYLKYPELKQCNIDGVDVHHKVVNQKLITTMDKGEFLVWCFTVDDANEAWTLREMGIDGITTNRPYWIQQKFYERISQEELEEENGGDGGY